MIFWQLLSTFFKIGLFTFGGGYAMLPLMQQEIEYYGWITQQEFVDIIAIAEMTPGAVSINTATFVGFRTAGLFGSITATAGVALPSLIIIILLSGFLEKYRDNAITKSIFAGIRPVVAGLIVSAAWFIAKSVLVPMDGFINGIGMQEISGFAIALIAFWLVYRYKIDPIKVIIGSAVVGLIIF